MNLNLPVIPMKGITTIGVVHYIKSY